MRVIKADFRAASAPSSLMRLCGLACALTATWSMYEAWRSEADVRQLKAAILVQTAALPAPAAPPYERSARQLLRERQMPWPEALAALEAASASGVVLDSFAFSAEGEAMRVQLSVSDHARLIRYVEALNVEAQAAGGELYWSLVQTQRDPATSRVVAILRGARLRLPN